MSLLNVSRLTFQYPQQTEPLFADVTFDVNTGDRIGLVGPNGAGKTTLLRLLTGELSASEGELAFRTDLRIGYIPQESPSSREGTVEEYVFEAFANIAETRRSFLALEPHMIDPNVAARYADLLGDYEAQGGYVAEAQTERVLDGLGFNERERRLPTAHLSSGQRARAELARLLLAPFDLLLIDEPTNHLDIAAVEWLEHYLSHIEAGYVMVSHDRVFLNRATNRIVEIRRGEMLQYTGNYEEYREQRTHRERHAQEEYDAQQRRRTAAARASERRHDLARRVLQKPGGGGEDRDHMGRIGAKVLRTARILKERVMREPDVDKPWDEGEIPVLDFPNVAPTDPLVIHADGLAKAVDEKQLFEKLSFRIGPGERWALVGPNGCGKTTLLHILRGEIEADAGVIHFGGRVRIGYYAQEGENLDPERTPLELCLDMYPDETWVRTILACLRMRREQPTRPLETMSGGERSKVGLARMLLSGANVLLLDEPTNHLDIEAREAVEATLTQFPGAILFVSHDRRFVETLADGVIDLTALRQ
ncbi:MAG: ABC-F family ATP-binding cassette domain-containing protein [Candidatus Poribacteria bacterium]|nr:ABC-F family ATP-binding cassette domain-containing protein [Candidatus Poribacteria bacterium]